jgi:hypothetical protein
MGHAGFQPSLFDVLQHGEGDFQGWTKSDQQRGGCSLVPPTRFYDTRRMGGISVRKEAGFGASSGSRLEQLKFRTNTHQKFVGSSLRILFFYLEADG